MKHFENFINSLFVLLLATAILFYIIQPAKFGLLVGHSMEPNMSDGDIFIYEPGEQADEGDVVVFMSEEHNMLVAHRVVFENETHYITQGDNNSFKDDPVKKESSLYKGQVVNYIETPWKFPVDQNQVLEIDNPLFQKLNS